MPEQPSSTATADTAEAAATADAAEAVAAPAPAFGAVLYVADVAAMSPFYAGVFELHPRDSGAGWATLVGAGIGAGFELVLHATPPAIAAAERAALAAGPRPPAAREDTPIKLRLPVADLATARQQAAARGGSLLPPEREWDWQGVRVCNGVDPEGNVFQAGQRLVLAAGAAAE